LITLPSFKVPVQDPAAAGPDATNQRERPRSQKATTEWVLTLDFTGHLQERKARKDLIIIAKTGAD
jgi:hypothetical protein